MSVGQRLARRERLKIAINTLPAKIGGPVSHLVNILPELARLDGVNRYVVLVTPDKKDLFHVDAPNFRFVVCPLLGRSLLLRVLWELFVLPFYLLFRRFDLLYSPACGTPLIRTIPQLCSIRAAFDEAGRLQPGRRDRLRYWLRDFRVRFEVHTSSKVTTVSESTRQKMSRHYGIRYDRIEVVHHGRSRTFWPKSRQEAGAFVWEHFGVNPPFLLVVSDLYPHKNCELVAEVFQRVREAGHTDLSLIWAGTLFPGRYTESIMKNVRLRNLEDCVHFVGLVGLDVLRFLYSGAECLLFLSRVETFGQPLLEAMSCDLPVVASNIPALCEVAGDAALFCSVTDADTCARHVCRLLEDSEFREQLVQRGRRRREHFSWERAARQMLELFEQMVPAQRGL